MRQSARHIYVPHVNEVFVNSWRARPIREYTIRKIAKIAGTRFLQVFIIVYRGTFRPDHEIQNRY